jgi:hypothetical protein
MEQQLCDGKIMRSRQKCTYKQFSISCYRIIADLNKGLHESAKLNMFSRRIPDSKAMQYGAGQNNGLASNSQRTLQIPVLIGSRIKRPNLRKIHIGF